MSHAFPYGWVLNLKPSVGMLLRHRGYLRVMNYCRREGSPNIWELEYIVSREKGSCNDWSKWRGGKRG